MLRYQTPFQEYLESEQVPVMLQKISQQKATESKALQ
jgi:hypothetical protein